jgi:co-chaperonin GroES (HSP10)
MSDFLSLMKGKEIEDEGIDFENYSLEEEITKFDGLNPVGHKILIRVYVPLKKDKTESGLYIPDNSASKAHDDERYRGFVGLVIKMGPECYLDERFIKGPRCQVGDWVTFTRAFGASRAWNGITAINVNDDDIMDIVDDPRKVRFLQ